MIGLNFGRNVVERKDNVLDIDNDIHAVGDRVREILEVFRVWKE